MFAVAPLDLSALYSGNLTSKTDARNIVTNQTYDGLNRVLTKTYSDSTTPGVAILNGTQLMSALGALVAADAARLNATASVAAAMSVEALLGTDVAFSAALQAARPHPGQVQVAAELRWLLRDSGLQRAHHASAHKVQDPYSLRCVPQVHGAVRDALEYLNGVLDVELNSATDNPLVFPEGGVADATNEETMRALGVRPWRRQASSEATSTAAGPRAARQQGMAQSRPGGARAQGCDRPGRGRRGTR